MKDLIIKILNGFEISPPNSIKLFKSDLDFKDSCSKYIIRSLMNKSMNNVLKRLTEEKSVELENLSDLFKIIFSLNRREVTCSISREKKGFFVIRLNRGLIQFIFDYTRLFCINYKIKFESSAYFERKKTDSNNLESVMIEILSKYWRRSYTKTEIYPLTSLSADNSKFMILNLYFGIQFFILHEITHKLNLDLDKRSLKEVLIPICNTYIEKYKYSMRFKEAIQKKWIEELECDDHAIQIIFSLINQQANVKKIISFSLFNYFLSHHLCEIYLNSKYPQTDDLITWETHPPYKVRLMYFLHKIELNVDKTFFQDFKNIMQSLEEFTKSLK